ncbi:hypothetical protein RCL1_003022 [Eukaryota sp. TZLM3-RCL]
MRLSLLLLLFLVFASASTWLNCADGNFFDSSNWLDSSIPTLGCNVVFPSCADEVTVLVDNSIYVNSISLGSNINLLFSSTEKLVFSHSIDFYLAEFATLSFLSSTDFHSNFSVFSDTPSVVLFSGDSIFHFSELFSVDKITVLDSAQVVINTLIASINSFQISGNSVFIINHGINLIASGSLFDSSTLTVNSNSISFDTLRLESDLATIKGDAVFYINNFELFAGRILGSSKSAPFMINYLETSSSISQISNRIIRVINNFTQNSHLYTIGKTHLIIHKPCLHFVNTERILVSADGQSSYSLVGTLETTALNVYLPQNTFASQAHIIVNDGYKLTVEHSARFTNGTTIDVPGLMDFSLPENSLVVFEDSFFTHTHSSSGVFAAGLGELLFINCQLNFLRPPSIHVSKTSFTGTLTLAGTLYSGSTNMFFKDVTYFDCSSCFFTVNGGTVEIDSPVRLSFNVFTISTGVVNLVSSISVITYEHSYGDRIGSGEVFASGSCTTGADNYATMGPGTLTCSGTVLFRKVQLLDHSLIIIKPSSVVAHFTGSITGSNSRIVVEKGRSVELGDAFAFLSPQHSISPSVFELYGDLDHLNNPHGYLINIIEWDITVFGSISLNAPLFFHHYFNVYGEATLSAVTEFVSSSFFITYADSLLTITSSCIVDLSGYLEIGGTLSASAGSISVLTGSFHLTKDSSHLSSLKNFIVSSNSASARIESPLLITNKIEVRNVLTLNSDLIINDDVHIESSYSGAAITGTGRLLVHGELTIKGSLAHKEMILDIDEFLIAEGATLNLNGIVLETGSKMAFVVQGNLYSSGLVTIKPHILSDPVLFPLSFKGNSGTSLVRLLSGSKLFLVQTVAVNNFEFILEGTNPQVTFDTNSVVQNVTFTSVSLSFVKFSGTASLSDVYFSDVVQLSFISVTACVFSFCRLPSDTTIWGSETRLLLEHSAVIEFPTTSTLSVEYSQLHVYCPLDLNSLSSKNGRFFFYSSTSIESLNVIEYADSVFFVSNRLLLNSCESFLDIRIGGPGSTSLGYNFPSDVTGTFTLDSHTLEILGPSDLSMTSFVMRGNSEIVVQNFDTTPAIIMVSSIDFSTFLNIASLKVFGFVKLVSAEQTEIPFGFRLHSLSNSSTVFEGDFFVSNHFFVHGDLFVSSDSTLSFSAPAEQLPAPYSNTVFDLNSRFFIDGQLIVNSELNVFGSLIASTSSKVSVASNSENSALLVLHPSSHVEIYSIELRVVGKDGLPALLYLPVSAVVSVTDVWFIDAEVHGFSALPNPHHVFPIQSVDVTASVRTILRNLKLYSTSVTSQSLEPQNRLLRNLYVDENSFIEFNGPLYVGANVFEGPGKMVFNNFSCVDEVVCSLTVSVGHVSFLGDVEIPEMSFSNVVYFHGVVTGDVISFSDCSHCVFHSTAALTSNSDSELIISRSHLILYGTLDFANSIKLEDDSILEFVYKDFSSTPNGPDSSQQTTVLYPLSNSFNCSNSTLLMPRTHLNFPHVIFDDCSVVGSLGSSLTVIEGSFRSFELISYDHDFTVIFESVIFPEVEEITWKLLGMITLTISDPSASLALPSSALQNFNVHGECQFNNSIVIYLNTPFTFTDGTSSLFSLSGEFLPVLRLVYSVVFSHFSTVNCNWLVESTSTLASLETKSFTSIFVKFLILDGVPVHTLCGGLTVGTLFLSSSELQVTTPCSPQVTVLSKLSTSSVDFSRLTLHFAPHSTWNSKDDTIDLLSNLEVDSQSFYFHDVFCSSSITFVSGYMFFSGTNNVIDDLTHSSSSSIILARNAKLSLTGVVELSNPVSFAVDNTKNYATIESSNVFNCPNHGLSLVNIDLLLTGDETHDISTLFLTNSRLLINGDVVFSGISSLEAASVHIEVDKSLQIIDSLSLTLTTVFTGSGTFIPFINSVTFHCSSEVVRHSVSISSSFTTSIPKFTLTGSCKVFFDSTVTVSQYRAYIFSSNIDVFFNNLDVHTVDVIQGTFSFGYLLGRLMVRVHGIAVFTVNSFYSIPLLTIRGNLLLHKDYETSHCEIFSGTIAGAILSCANSITIGEEVPQGEIFLTKGGGIRAVANSLTFSSVDIHGDDTSLITLKKTSSDSSIEFNGLFRLKGSGLLRIFECNVLVQNTFQSEWSAILDESQLTIGFNNWFQVDDLFIDNGGVILLTGGQLSFSNGYFSDVNFIYHGAVTCEKLYYFSGTMQVNSEDDFECDSLYLYSSVELSSDFHVEGNVYSTAVITGNFFSVTATNYFGLNTVHSYTDVRTPLQVSFLPSDLIVASYEEITYTSVAYDPDGFTGPLINGLLFIDGELTVRGTILGTGIIKTYSLKVEGSNIFIEPLVFILSSTDPTVSSTFTDSFTCSHLFSRGKLILNAHVDFVAMSTTVRLDFPPPSPPLINSVVTFKSTVYVLSDTNIHTWISLQDNLQIVTHNHNIFLFNLLYFGSSSPNVGFHISHSAKFYFHSLVQFTASVYFLPSTNGVMYSLATSFFDISVSNFQLQSTQTLGHFSSLVLVGKFSLNSVDISYGCSFTAYSGLRSKNFNSINGHFVGHFTLVSPFSLDLQGKVSLSDGVVNFPFYSITSALSEITLLNSKLLLGNGYTTFNIPSPLLITGTNSQVVFLSSVVLKQDVSVLCPSIFSGSLTVEADLTLSRVLIELASVLTATSSDSTITADAMLIQGEISPYTTASFDISNGLTLLPHNFLSTATFTISGGFSLINRHVQDLTVSGGDVEIESNIGSLFVSGGSVVLNSGIQVDTIQVSGGVLYVDESVSITNQLEILGGKVFVFNGLQVSTLSFSGGELQVTGHLDISTLFQYSHNNIVCINCIVSVPSLQLGMYDVLFNFPLTATLMVLIHDKKLHAEITEGNHLYIVSTISARVFDVEVIFGGDGILTMTGPYHFVDSNVGFSTSVFNVPQDGSFAFESCTVLVSSNFNNHGTFSVIDDFALLTFSYAVINTYSIFGIRNSTFTNSVFNCHRCHLSCRNPIYFVDSELFLSRGSDINLESSELYFDNSVFKTNVVDLYGNSLSLERSNLISNSLFYIDLLSVTTSSISGNGIIVVENLLLDYSPVSLTLTNHFLFVSELFKWNGGDIVLLNSFVSSIDSSLVLFEFDCSIISGDSDSFVRFNGDFDFSFSELIVDVASEFLSPVLLNYGSLVFSAPTVFNSSVSLTSLSSLLFTSDDVFTLDTLTGFGFVNISNGMVVLSSEYSVFDTEIFIDGGHLFVPGSENFLSKVVVTSGGIYASSSLVMGDLILNDGFISGEGYISIESRFNMTGGSLLSSGTLHFLPTSTLFFDVVEFTNERVLIFDSECSLNTQRINFQGKGSLINNVAITFNFGVDFLISGDAFFSSFVPGIVNNGEIFIQENARIFVSYIGSGNLIVQQGYVHFYEGTAVQVTCIDVPFVNIYRSFTLDKVVGHCNLQLESQSAAIYFSEIDPKSVLNVFSLVYFQSSSPQSIVVFLSEYTVQKFSHSFGELVLSERVLFNEFAYVDGTITGDFPLIVNTLSFSQTTEMVTSNDIFVLESIFCHVDALSTISGFNTVIIPKTSTVEIIGNIVFTSSLGNVVNILGQVVVKDFSTVTFNSHVLNYGLLQSVDSQIIFNSFTYNHGEISVFSDSVIRFNDAFFCFSSLFSSTSILHLKSATFYSSALVELSQSQVDSHAPGVIRINCLFNSSTSVFNLNSREFVIETRAQFTVSTFNVYGPLSLYSNVEILENLNYFETADDATGTSLLIIHGDLNIYADKFFDQTQNIMKISVLGNLHLFSNVLCRVELLKIHGTFNATHSLHFNTNSILFITESGSLYIGKSTILLSGRIENHGLIETYQESVVASRVYNYGTINALHDLSTGFLESNGTIILQSEITFHQNCNLGGRVFGSGTVSFSGGTSKITAQFSDFVVLFFSSPSALSATFVSVVGNFSVPPSVYIQNFFTKVYLYNLGIPYKMISVYQSGGLYIDDDINVYEFYHFARLHGSGSLTVLEYFEYAQFAEVVSSATVALIINFDFVFPSSVYKVWGGNIVLKGHCIMSSTVLDLKAPAVLINDGILDLNFDTSGNFFDGSYSVIPLFINNGIVNKYGSGTITVHNNFENFGTLNIFDGRIYLSSSETSSSKLSTGSFNVYSPSFLGINHHKFSSFSKFYGNGTVIFSLYSLKSLSEVTYSEIVGIFNFEGTIRITMHSLRVLCTSPSIINYELLDHLILFELVESFKPILFGTSIVFNSGSLLASDSLTLQSCTFESPAGSSSLITSDNVIVTIKSLMFASPLALITGQGSVVVTEIASLLQGTISVGQFILKETVALAMIHSAYDSLSFVNSNVFVYTRALSLGNIYNISNSIFTLFESSKASLLPSQVSINFDRSSSFVVLGSLVQENAAIALFSAFDSESVFIVGKSGKIGQNHGTIEFDINISSKGNWNLHRSLTKFGVNYYKNPVIEFLSGKLSGEGTISVSYGKYNFKSEIHFSTRMAEFNIILPSISVNNDDDVFFDCSHECFLGNVKVENDRTINFDGLARMSHVECHGCTFSGSANLTVFDLSFYSGILSLDSDSFLSTMTLFCSPIEVVKFLSGNLELRGLSELNDVNFLFGQGNLIVLPLATLTINSVFTLTLSEIASNEFFIFHDLIGSNYISKFSCGSGSYVGKLINYGQIEFKSGSFFIDVALENHNSIKVSNEVLYVTAFWTNLPNSKVVIHSETMFDSEFSLENFGFVDIVNNISVVFAGDYFSFHISSSFTITSGHLLLHHNAKFHDATITVLDRLSLLGNSDCFDCFIRVDQGIIEFDDLSHDFSGSQISLQNFAEMLLKGTSSLINLSYLSTESSTVLLVDSSFLQLSTSSSLNLFNHSYLLISEHVLVNFELPSLFLSSSSVIDFNFEDGSFVLIDFIEINSDSVLNIMTNANFQCNNLTLFDGVINGSSVIIVNDYFDWTSGLLTSRDSFSTQIEGIAFISSSLPKTLFNHNLLINGFVFITGDLEVFESSIIFVTTSGDILVENFESGRNLMLSGTGLLENHGKLTFSSDNPIIFDLPLFSSSIITVNGNNILFSSSLALILGSKFSLISCGIVEFSPTSTIQNKGDVVINMTGDVIFSGNISSKADFLLLNGSVFFINSSVSECFFKLEGGFLSLNDHSYFDLFEIISLSGNVSIKDFVVIQDFSAFIHGNSVFQLADNALIYNCFELRLSDFSFGVITGNSFIKNVVIIRLFSVSSLVLSSSNSLVIDDLRIRNDAILNNLMKNLVINYVLLFHGSIYSTNDIIFGSVFWRVSSLICTNNFPCSFTFSNHINLAVGEKLISNLVLILSNTTFNVHGTVHPKILAKNSKVILPTSASMLFSGSAFFTFNSINSSFLIDGLFQVDQISRVTLNAPFFFSESSTIVLHGNLNVGDEGEIYLETTQSNLIVSSSSQVIVHGFFSSYHFSWSHGSLTFYPNSLLITNYFSCFNCTLSLLGPVISNLYLDFIYFESSDVVLEDFDYHLEVEIFTANFSTVTFMNSLAINISHSFSAFDSFINFVSLHSQLFMYKFEISEGFVHFATGFPVIIQSFLIDNIDHMITSDEIVVVDQIFVQNSLSPTPECCPTSNCLVVFELSGAYVLESFASFSTSNVLESSINFDGNLISFSLQDLYSYSIQKESLVVSVNVPIISYQNFIEIPICPLVLDYIFASTEQTIITLKGTNFGTFPLTLLSSSLPIVSSLLPFEHSFISLLLGDGAGCGHWIELQRPTDTSKSRIDFCFEPPFISFINPNPFPLTGLLEIHGSGFHWKHTVFNFSGADVELRSFEMTSSLIILDVISVCSPISESVSLSLNVMGQESNIIEIPLRFPVFNITPPFLTRRVNSLKFNGNNLEFLFNSNCFSSYSIIAAEPVTLEYSFANPNSADFVFINHLAFEEIPVYLNLNEFLWTSFTVPVALFVASTPEFACVTNSDCNFLISNFADEFDLTLFNIIVGPGVTLISSNSGPNSASISVFPRRSGLLELELCNWWACVPIFNLPIISEIILFEPRNIQWMDVSSLYSINLIGTGFDRSSLDQWSQTVKFDGFFEIQSIDFNLIVLKVLINESRIFSISFDSDLGLSENILEIFVSNFVTSVPVIPHGWVLSLYSTVFVPDLIAIVGTNTYRITSGSNSINTPSVDTNVLIASSSNFLVVSKVVGSPFMNIPTFVQFGTVFNSFISLEYLFDYDLSLNSSVVCLSGCNLISSNFENFKLNFSFYIPDLGTAELMASFYYLNSKFSRQFFISSVSPPVFDFPYTFITVSSGLYLTFSGVFDTFCVDSKFLIDDVILENFGKFDCSTVMRFCKCKFFIDLSNHSFNYGETNVTLTWQSLFSEFEPILISKFTIFSGSFMSSDYLSLFRSSNLSFYLPNLRGYGYYGVVDGQIYQSNLIGDFLVFSNVLVSTYQPFVEFSIFYRDFLLESIEIPIEAVLEEICFVEERIIPLISSSNFELQSNHVTKSIIFDGNRCCARTIADCSIEVPINSQFSIIFDRPFDLISLVITVNSSCSMDSFSIINFPNIESNISHHCSQIPNGFSFALMCEFDLNIGQIEVLDIDFLNNFSVLELELYGFQSNICYKISDFYSGSGYFGLPISLVNSSIKFDGQSFSNFNELLVYEANRPKYLITNQSIIFDCWIFNYDCFVSELFYSFEYFTSKPKNVSLKNSVIPFQSNLIEFEIDCFDEFGFIIPCNSINFSFSSFNYSSFRIFSSSIEFSMDSIIFGNHFLSLILDDVIFELFFTVVQNPGDFLQLSSIITTPCDDSVSGLFSCSLIKFDLFYVNVLELSNQSFLIDFFNVEFSFSNDVTFFSRISNSIIIHSSPLSIIKINVNYSNLFISTEIISSNCSSKALIDGKCLCPLGTFLQSGSCSPCPFSTFLDSFSQLSCTPCSWPRITSTIGSSSESDCHCPNGQLEIQNSCQTCPKFVTCVNGSVDSVIDSVLFNYSSGQAITCPFKFLCRNNSCRFKFSGNYCTACIGNCLTQINIFLRIFYLVLLLCIVFYVDKLLKFYNRKAVKHLNIASKFSLHINSFKNSLKSNVICPMLLLICTSLISTGTISALSFALRFSSSLFSFDPFLVVIRFLMLFICAYFSWRKTEEKTFVSVISLTKFSFFITTVAVLSAISLYSKLVGYFYDNSSFNLLSIIFDCLLFFGPLLLQLRTCSSIPTLLFAILIFCELFSLLQFWILTTCLLVVLLPFYSNYNQILLFVTSISLIYRISFLVF